MTYSEEIFFTNSFWTNKEVLIQRFVDHFLGLKLLDMELEELSPGFSQSKVFRLKGTDTQGTKHSYILKIPDFGSNSKLQVADPFIIQRELWFFESALPGLLQNHLNIPKVLGIDNFYGKDCIWLEDRKNDFLNFWSHTDLRLAVRYCADLHEVYLQNRKYIDGLTWLSRQAYRNYELHLQEAKNNMAKLAGQPTLLSELDAKAIDQLQICLDRYDWALKQLCCLPMTMIHGDFHPGNIGFCPDKKLLLIDWANVGIAPLGSDIGIFISLYQLFGGINAVRDPLFEQELIQVYCYRLAEITGWQDNLFSDVQYAVWLWAFTWGLHLRLGPGLSEILENKNIEEALRQAIVRDILDGCHRVLEKFKEFL